MKRNRLVLYGVGLGIACLAIASVRHTSAKQDILKAGIHLKQEGMFCPVDDFGRCGPRYFFANSDQAKIEQVLSSVGYVRAAGAYSVSSTRFQYRNRFLPFVKGERVGFTEDGLFRYIYFSTEGMY